MVYYHGRNNVITKCSNQTIWFERFVRGVDMRVVSKYRLYQATRIEVMELSMEKIEVAVKWKVLIVRMR